MAEAAQSMKEGLRSFGRYVPTGLVRQLIRSGTEATLGAEIRELTVLFTDIAGFTPIVESTPPDKVLDALGEYLEGMNVKIGDEGGTVCQYLGDAIMAFWGAPVEQPDHALRACRAALTMRRWSHHLVADAPARGLPALPTRFGVNTGDVMVGNIGAPQRFNYACLGDPVNTAARLEGLNKAYGTQILVGQQTAEMVGDALMFRPLDWVRMKGKALPMLVHELVGAPGELSEDAQTAIEHYRQGLYAYRERRFGEAADLFRQAGDAPSEVMIARCEAYQANPPPSEWDGVFVMTTK
jgi:adenylate cyclase